MNMTKLNKKWGNRNIIVSKSTHFKLNPPVIRIFSHFPTEGLRLALKDVQMAEN